MIYRLARTFEYSHNGLYEVRIQGLPLSLLIYKYLLSICIGTRPFKDHAAYEPHAHTSIDCTYHIIIFLKS